MVCYLEHWRNEKLKKFLSFCLLIALVCTGCVSEKNKKGEMKPEYEEYIEVVNSTECVITDTSAISADFKVFNLEMNEQNDDLALSDLVIMFPVEECFYIYFTMPADQDTYAYRVKDMVINEKCCELELIGVEGYYQKYKLYGVEEIITDDNLYQISRINLYNENNKEETYTYNIRQNVTAVLDEEKFFFEQEYFHNITLKGQMFESIYQFNEENNVLVDLWSKVIGDVERLDEDRRSFFYFAFKCYDTERKIHFKPEDILQLDVEYMRLSYEYMGEDSEIANNLEPEKNEISESIKPDARYITSSDKRSNKKAYKYNTINKLSEADLTQNIGNANAEILRQAAKQYDWAVQFGAGDGYIHKSNEAGIWNKTYDINYTEIEDFKTIYIVYRHEGKTISTKTNSLILEKSTEVVEMIPEKPSKNEERQYDLHTVWQDENLMFYDKIVKSLHLILEPSIPWIILMLIVIGVLKFRKTKSFKYIGEIIEKKLKKLSEEDD